MVLMLELNGTNETTLNAAINKLYLKSGKNQTIITQALASFKIRHKNMHIYTDNKTKPAHNKFKKHCQIYNFFHEI